MNITIGQYQVSQPVAVGAGSIVTVTPGAGATATVEYTTSSSADIGNRVAVWSSWAKGAVSSVTKDYCADSVFMRVTAQGGAVSLDVNSAPSAADLAAFTSDWGVGGVQYAYDVSGNAVGIVGPKGPIPFAGSSAPIIPATVTTAYSYAVVTNSSPGRFLHVARLRRSFICRNASAYTMQVAPSTRLNNDANPPTSGWIDLAPGQELTESFTSRQWFIRAKAIPLTALTSSGTVATATLANHGLATGHQVDIQGATPAGYNVTDVYVTVINSSTFTYPIASAQSAVTVLPGMQTASQSVDVEIEVAV